MLVLSRRPQQSLRIGHDIVITIVEINGDRVRIGIEAPPEVEVHRQEVYDDVQRANRAAAAARPEMLGLITRRAGGTGENADPGEPSP